MLARARLPYPHLRGHALSRRRLARARSLGSCQCRPRRRPNGALARLPSQLKPAPTARFEVGFRTYLHSGTALASLARHGRAGGLLIGPGS